jgi:hypothetical protein
LLRARQDAHLGLRFIKDVPSRLADAVSERLLALPDDAASDLLDGRLERG